MDLLLATILIALTSLWVMIIGYRQGQKHSGRSRLRVQGIAAVASLLYFAFVWDRPWIAGWVPHTALIVLVNWHPLMGAFFAGMYLSSTQVGPARRYTIGPLTLLLAAYAIVAPLTGRPPVCEPDASDGALITQTTPYTCSAAAAASLLRLHGIETDEAEMAELCLTRKGTHWMGVYRGLKLMTQESEWDVVAQPFSHEAVMNLHETPAILSVNVDTDSIARTEDHGFRSESGHSVLALRSSNNHEVIVFDPSPAYGIECWDRELLSWVSDGVILRLVPRSGPGFDAPVRDRINRATREIDEIAYVSWSRPL